MKEQAAFTFVESPSLLMAACGHFGDLQRCGLFLRGSAMPPESARGTTSRHNTHIVSQDPWFRQLTMWVLCYTVVVISFLKGLEWLLLLQKCKKKSGKSAFYGQFSRFASLQAVAILSVFYIHRIFCPSIKISLTIS